MDEDFQTSLDDLRLFFLLDQAGSISGATRRFGIAKATLSRSLARLEDRAGMPLFDRTSRGLKLTQAGALMLPAARDATEAGALAEDVLRTARGEPEGLLRIAASALSAQQILGPVVAEFTRRHPKVIVRIHISGVGPDPLEEELDLVLRLGRPEESYLIARRIIGSRFALYAGREDAERLAHAPREAIDTLRRVVIDVPGAPADWTLTNAAGETLTLRSDPACLVGDPGVALGIIRAGTGLAFLPEVFGEPRAASGDFARILPDFHGPEIEIFASFPPKRASIPAVRAFLDLLVEMTAAALPAPATKWE
ncbi:LysR family transcriptional regulator [Jannaschia aquimarina]|uniref:DmlR_3 protein n=1 Tax=Jannaschia aquimarina TaxID=935700 RepID=A0A0D1EMI1_9RHOB|nr:LysR family transcriptional regulator [Jannaschia aquimarina]KIT16900.1 HTH-type transcriptional regulator DmlR [Jannaschia aquimarina]SNT12010.1 transcriptional regulator, LysR family [Jannaschia aquimarina]